jgi:hypothetical protein
LPGTNFYDIGEVLEKEGLSKMSDRGEVSESTRSAEQEDAKAKHQPDRPPTSDEAEAADEDVLEEGVAEHYQDMAERGAKQKGEGRID